MHREKQQVRQPVTQPEIRSASIESHEDEDSQKRTEKETATQTETDLEGQDPNLYHVRSHVSTHDHPGFTHEHGQHHEPGEEIYDRFSAKRKVLIVSIMSFCAFLAPVSSTSILAASPEVVATYNTTGTVFNVSNALYLVFMGLSPLLWGPIGQTYGRRPSLCFAAVTFTGFSVGTALAPNLAAFFVFRMLTAFQGTAFLIVGGTVIGDIYKPVERGTAYGWFMSGTLIGPALGPFIGGIIVTFVSWRDIFWLQTALAGVASLAVIVFLPETIHRLRSDELAGLTRAQQARLLWSWINPMRVVVVLFRYPNLLVVGLASSSLVWNMYSLLTPIRYLLDPRFGLTTPLQAGLFYIAPGCGYLVGTFFGGRWADRVVRVWIQRRGGVRVAEDRLRSCRTAMGIVIPACVLVYGWTVERRVGGIPVPVIAMFIQGVAQLFCFPSLNTYCLDVMHARSSEVVAGNYFMRYLFAAAGSAAVLPIIDAIGLGWFSTISALFVVVAALGTCCVSAWGQGWRERIDRSKQAEDAA